MRVLITGAGGKMGRTIAAGLKDRYQLRGLDLRECGDVPGLAEAVTGDLADYDTVRRACEDMDAIIHLGGLAGGREPWETVLQCNIIGTRNVFEAAWDSGAKRIAFASRAGLLASYPQHMTRTVDMPPRPNNYYSISKVFGENVGYMYASDYDMQVVCVRIGNFKADRPHPEHPHHLGHRDCVRVFERAIIHPGVRFEIVFGVSGSNWRLYDLEHGKQAIGYEPIDYAEVEVPS